MTPKSKLYMMMQNKAFRGPDIVRFLKHLLRHISGALLVIWDGLAAHRSQPIKTFLQEGAAKRLHLEQLPGYAPDLNPDEERVNPLIIPATFFCRVDTYNVVTDMKNVSTIITGHVLVYQRETISPSTSGFNP